MLMGSQLAENEIKRTLEIVVGSSTKMLTQWVAEVKKAHYMLGITKKGVGNKMANVCNALCRAIMQPHLEYCA